MGNCLTRWQKNPLSPSPSLSSLLILIEKEKERLGKQERRRRKGRRRGATAQAKGSPDIHGNLQTHSAAIISINAERQQRGKGWGHGGVREFFWGGGGGVNLDGVDGGEEDAEVRARNVLNS